MTRIMTWLLGTCRGATQGQSLVLIALLMPVLAGVSGLALDAGNLYAQRRALQSIADAAALTGAQVANFNVDDPAILPGGATQARDNAVANGMAGADVTVNLPPSAASGAYAGRPDYIEVIVTRTMRNPFMALFGREQATVTARAVARCVKPGYGTPAVLALSNAPDAIRFNGGGSSAVRVVGDILSHGGIDPNGDASNFQIEGAAYALTQPAPTNLTTTNGIYGGGDDLGYLDVPDPVAQGLTAATPSFQWPSWPATNPGSLGCVTWQEPDGPDLDTNPESGSDCDGSPPDIDADWWDVVVGAGRYTSGLTVRNGATAVFETGVAMQGTLIINGTATLHSGYYQGLSNNATLIFEPGAYQFADFALNNNSVTTGAGVVFRITGSATFPVGSSGNAQFEFSAWKPYTDSTPPPGPVACSPYPCNTWMNIVFSIENGGLNFTGNGVDRAINGSIYAPNGEVAISGNGGGSVVNGQVIANTVVLGGNGPVVNYVDDSSKGTFGPILVNTPDR